MNSLCCNAPVRVAGSGEGTQWHECEQCGKACEVNLLDAKYEALEKLVIELTLIAIAAGNIKHHHKARLDQLLGDLQYAGQNENENPV